MRARPGKVKKRTDLGLGCRDQYGHLTYRAVDVAVSVCFYGIVAVLPALLPVTAWSARRLSGSFASAPERASLGPST